MSKQVFTITRCWFETKDIVAEDYESAVEKFEESPTHFHSINQGHIESEAATPVTEEPPINQDGELICGRYITARKYSRKEARKCRNRVSEPFEPCHLHETSDSERKTGDNE